MYHISDTSCGMDRRALLRRLARGAAGTVAALYLHPLATGRAASAPEVLTFLGHNVHKGVITGTRGGAAINLLDPLLKSLGVQRAEWITLGNQPVHDRLFREVGLPQTNIDIAFLLNSYTYPEVARLFEPLDPYMAQDPIEDFDDFFEPMRRTFSVDGKQFAIPMRATTTTLHYNQEYFQQRGVEGPPQSMEEFVDYAHRLTFTKPNGEKVYGFSIQGAQTELYLPLLDLARAWGDGDYINERYEIVCNQPAMVQAVTMLRDLFKAGVIPTNFNALTNNEEVQHVQYGRVAMSIHGSNYYWTFNDPKNSLVAGKMGIANIPVSRSLRGKYEVAPTKTEFWGFVIPRRARHKEISWSIIRALSSKQSTLAIALNGNGPTRASTYDHPDYRREIPYAALEQRVLKVSRPPFPLVRSTAQLVDIIGQAAQQAIVGQRSPQAAMDAAAEQIQRVLRA